MNSFRRRFNRLKLSDKIAARSPVDPGESISLQGSIIENFQNHADELEREVAYLKDCLEEMEDKIARCSKDKE
mgnify:CR=1 FL=1